MLKLAQTNPSDKLNHIVRLRRLLIRDIGRKNEKITEPNLMNKLEIADIITYNKKKVMILNGIFIFSR